MWYREISNQYGEMDSYLDYYKNDSENGIVYSDDYDSYGFMSENYKSACENIRKFLEEIGAEEVRRFFQNEITKFMK